MKTQTDCQIRHEAVYDTIMSQLADIKTALKAENKRFTRDSGNWAYVGSLENISAKLSELQEFLNYED